MQYFSAREAYAHAWKTLRAHSGVLLPGAVVLTLLNWAGLFFADIESWDATIIAGAVCQMLASIILTAGYYRICLRISEHHPVSLRDVIPSGYVALRYIGATILQGLAFVGGFILLVVPGLYFGVRLFFAGFASIDGARPMESLHVSVRLTQGIFWQLAAFVLLSIVIQWVGAILYVGTLVSLPLTSLAAAHVYVKLKSRA